MREKRRKESEKDERERENGERKEREGEGECGKKMKEREDREWEKKRVGRQGDREKSLREEMLHTRIDAQCRHMEYKQVSSKHSTCFCST